MANNCTIDSLNDYLKKILTANMSNQEVFDILTMVINHKTNNTEEKYIILLLVDAILKNPILYNVSVLILAETIKNNLFLSYFTADAEEKVIEPTSTKQVSLGANALKNTEKRIQENKVPNADGELIDLTDQEALKAYFLQKQKHLDSNGNFEYPCEGCTAIIASGDNMTIPGYFFTINYVIDHNGDVVDIKGYPEMKKTRAQYEEVYSDLIANLFNEEL